jgi:hypothetical protein
VFLWGGTDDAGQPLSNGDLFDPETQSFSLVDTLAAQAEATTEGPSLAASIPEDGAQNVPLQVGFPYDSRNA